jgi:carbonic anhydrase
VVVLGHTGCGAVDVTLEAVQQHSAETSGNVNAIVEEVRPAVEHALAAHAGADRELIVNKAVRANVRSSATALRRGSATLERLIRDDGLMVVGAEYSLETGIVEFFDGLPGAG